MIMTMVIVGVFINSEFEKYNMNLVRNDMINISQNIIDKQQPWAYWLSTCQSQKLQLHLAVCQVWG